jgi:hypothetical protein
MYYLMYINDFFIFLSFYKFFHHYFDGSIKIGYITFEYFSIMKFQAVQLVFSVGAKSFLKKKEKDREKNIRGITVEG